MTEQGGLTLLLDVVNTTGVVGVLIFMVIGFYKGDLIPKVILDRILKVYEKQVEAFGKRILERIDSLITMQEKKN